MMAMMLNPDQDSEPGFRGINLWREGDGKQKLGLHIQDLKNVFLEILTHADVGESDLFLDAAKQRRLCCCGWCTVVVLRRNTYQTESTKEHAI